MQATLYTSAGPVPYDPSTGLERSFFSPEDTDIPFEMHEPPPVITDPIDTDFSDEGSDFSTGEMRAALDRYFWPDGGKFYWYTHDDEMMEVQDMATPNIFYALRMVWNHSVPRVWRVGNYKPYSDVSKWSEEYRKAAINTLAAELATREDDLNEDCRQQLFEMVLKTIYILDLGI